MARADHGTCSYLPVLSLRCMHIDTHTARSLMHTHTFIRTADTWCLIRRVKSRCLRIRRQDRLSQKQSRLHYRRLWFMSWTRRGARTPPRSCPTCCTLARSCKCTRRVDNHGACAQTHMCAHESHTCVEYLCHTVFAHDGWHFRNSFLYTKQNSSRFLTETLHSPGPWTGTSQNFRLWLHSTRQTLYRTSLQSSG